MNDVDPIRWKYSTKPIGKVVTETIYPTGIEFKVEFIVEFIEDQDKYIWKPKEITIEDLVEKEGCHFDK